SQIMSELKYSCESTIGTAADRLESLSGQCPAAVIAPGSVRVTLPAFGWMVCRANESLKP
ncbi:MAG: hypothetical protein V4521_15650, partial [Pseudomonadota bacterium]